MENIWNRLWKLMRNMEMFENLHSVPNLLNHMRESLHYYYYYYYLGVTTYYYYYYAH